MGDDTSLDWPDDFDRTPAEYREPYPHNFRVTKGTALENIRDELRKMGARHARVEVGDGGDPGVVAYFQRDGADHAVPCDRWDNLRDNAQAIAKYLDAKRALERYGVETVESEFSTAAVGLSRKDE